MYCENCGASIPNDSRFCPECGKEQISDPETAVLRCPDCGTELEPDSLFCENCGRKLSGQPAQKRAVPPASPARPERQKASDIPPIPPASPDRTRDTSIPRAPQAAVRETISPGEPKAKKKSGCGTAVLIILILLVLAAGYYVWKVYDARPNDVIGRVISGIKPSAGKTYDARNYSTSETARLQDFLWVTQDIVKGSLPAGHDRLTEFDELIGGWKAYIIDDLNGQYGSGIERLCQAAFTKDANGNGMTFTWAYIHNTKTDEGYNDYTPPTTFYGEMQNGSFHGLGTGSIDMTDFYVLNGHEYAIGTLHWPDAVTGTVFLVRP